MMQGIKKNTVDRKCTSVSPVTREYSGEFAEQILSDLISQGYQGEELMRRFRSMNCAMRPAVESMLTEVSSLDPAALPGMDDIFPPEEE